MACILSTEQFPQPLPPAWCLLMAIYLPVTVIWITWNTLSGFNNTSAPASEISLAWQSRTPSPVWSGKWSQACLSRWRDAQGGREEIRRKAPLVPSVYCGFSRGCGEGCSNRQSVCIACVDSSYIMQTPVTWTLYSRGPVKSSIFLYGTLPWLPNPSQTAKIVSFHGAGLS